MVGCVVGDRSLVSHIHSLNCTDERIDNRTECYGLGRGGRAGPVSVKPVFVECQLDYDWSIFGATSVDGMLPSS